MTENHICIHDAEIISYNVDFKRQILDINVEIVFPENLGKTATISFVGAIAHEFSDATSQQNVIFDIEKESVVEYIDANREYFKEKLSYAFPIWTKSPRENDIEQLKNVLTESQIFVFSISSSVGLNGIVFAKEMRIFEN